MNLRNTINYLNEVINEPTTSFSKYFYDDIANYLDIDYLLKCSDDNSILEHLQEIITDDNKYNLLLNCKTKEEVKEWLDNIASYILKNIDEQQLIYDCLN